MTIEDLGNLGDLIAAIATLATLAYLAVQIRQNTKSQQGATIQSHAHLELDTSTLIIQHASVYSRGCKDLSDLNDEEKIIFERIAIAEMTLLANAFAQYENGLIADFDPWITDWKLTYMTQPGFLAIWAEQKGTYDHKFSQYIDEISTPIT